MSKETIFADIETAAKNQVRTHADYEAAAVVLRDAKAAFEEAERLADEAEEQMADALTALRQHVVQEPTP